MQTRLDLTCPEPSQFELIRALIQAYPQNPVVHAGVHHVPRERQLFLKKSVSYRIDLNKGFMRFENENGVSLAVIRKVVADNNLFGKYLLEGLLEPAAGNGYTFQSFPEMVGLVVKSEIDPTAMTQAQNQLLGSILLGLLETNQMTFLPSGISSSFMFFEDHCSVVMTMNLKYPIVLRSRGKYPHQVRFEVLGKEINKGAFGTILSVLTTLEPQNDGSLLAENHHRVIKQGHVKGYVSSNEVRYDLPYEHKIASMTPHLHVKLPVMKGGDEKIWLMVEKHINGFDLEKFAAPHGGLSKLSLDQRLKLVLEMIRSFDHQVLTQGLIHRDIKPANIIKLFEDQNFPRAFYVDFGLSRKASDTAGHSNCGTPAYVPPEVWAGKNDSFATDVYGLGVVIGRIFGAHVPNSHKHSNSAAPRHFANLFSGVNDITEDQKQKIKAILENMCAGDFTRRPSLSAVADEFDTLRFENALQKVPQNDQDLLKRVHADAREFSRKLNEYCSKYAGSWDYAYLRKEFLHELNRFPDRPVFVREFVAELGVYVLQQCESRHEVIAKLNALTTAYTLVREQLEAELTALQEILKSIPLETRSKGYAAYLSQLYQDGAARYLYTPQRLDDLEELSLKCRRVSQKIESERQYMDDLPKGTVLGEGRRYPLLDGCLPDSIRELFLPPSDRPVDSRAVAMARKG